MICLKCQRDVDAQQGGSYIFHYGNQTGKTRRGRTTITHYQIAGSEEPFLCNNCVFAHAMQKRATTYRGWGIFFIVAACVLAVITLLALDSSTAEICWLAVGLGLAYAVSLFLMGSVEKKRIVNQDFASMSKSAQRSAGTSLAMATRKADLQARGFRELFTPERMRQLKQPVRR